MSRAIAKFAASASAVFLIGMLIAGFLDGSVGRNDTGQIPLAYALLVAMATVPALAVFSLVHRYRGGERGRAFAELLLVPLAGAATYFALVGAGWAYTVHVRNEIEAMKRKWELTDALVLSADAN